MRVRFLAVVHKDANSDYGVHFPDVPGCYSGGETVEEAFAEAARGLAAHLELLREMGREIPAATDRFCADDIDVAGFVVAGLVEAEIEEPARRINISLPATLADRIDAAAAARGMNRSAFLAEGARRLMEAE